jgi:hypothetical protein
LVRAAIAIFISLPFAQNWFEISKFLRGKLSLFVVTMEIVYNGSAK